MIELKILFWVATFLVFYTYVGYPLVLLFGAGTKRKRQLEAIPSATALPTVSLLIPACNEEQWIARKIENTLALDYPSGLLEITVVSDGSADRTVEIARRYGGQGVAVVVFLARLGKQEMFYRLVTRTSGSILVMTDANALLSPDALQELVRPLADPNVSCCVGRRVCIVQGRSVSSVAESFYWRYESLIQRMESRWHSCLAAAGQLYSVRRSVFPYVERVGEDFYIPMKVLASTGKRIAYAPSAVAAIPAAANLSIEFERKTHAHIAFLVSLPRLKNLLAPGRTPVCWQFISHHILPMLIPAALAATLFCAYLLQHTNSFYFVATVAQILFYTLALIGAGLAVAGFRPKILYFPFYFVFAELAVCLAWIRWPLGKFDYAWQRTERLTDAS